MIKKGTWVQIHKIILEPKDRAPQVPDDTKKIPLEMWVKGFLVEDGNLGEIVQIKTLTNRIEEGELVQENPSFKHNFGHFVPEIIQIGQMVKDFMFGDEINE
ncbi:2-amino-4-ketopentanoate thiolase [Mycoplasmatota bacterium]|nr:2-amino-4-ketopentanoate thiolase [Mycoplasmatota bacterium]